MDPCYTSPKGETKGAAMDHSLVHLNEIITDTAETLGAIIQRGELTGWTAAPSYL